MAEVLQGRLAKVKVGGRGFGKAPGDPRESLRRWDGRHLDVVQIVRPYWGRFRRHRGYRKRYGGRLSGRRGFKHLENTHRALLLGFNLPLKIGRRDNGRVKGPFAPVVTLPGEPEPESPKCGTFPYR